MKSAVLKYAPKLKVELTNTEANPNNNWMRGEQACLVERWFVALGDLTAEICSQCPKIQHFYTINLYKRLHNRMDTCDLVQRIVWLKIARQRIHDILGIQMNYGLYSAKGIKNSA